MLASELIAELGRAVERLGDLPVEVAVTVAPGSSTYASSQDIEVGGSEDGERIEIVGQARWQKTTP